MLWVYYAEILKYKRTSALFLAIGIPFAINLLFLLVFALSKELRESPADQLWTNYLSGLHSSWLQLFLPIGLGILAALALGLEHQDNQWKQLLTLGVARVPIFLAKWLAVLSLIFLGAIALALSSLLIGGIVTGFQKIPWLDIFKAPLLSFLGSLGIVSIQVWLATRFKAFGVSIGVALFGAILGGIAIQSATYWKFVPWAYPAGAFGLANPNNTLAIGLSLAVTLVVVVLAARDFQTRDML